MKLITRAMLLAGLLAALTATAAFAEEPETTGGFVCPVLGGQAGDDHGNSSPGFATIGDGDASVIGPDVTVPVHATNDNGAGKPGGDHASPGDANYTAIWGG